MLRYIEVLNGIQRIQMIGFATLLDTATPTQIDDHEKAVSFLESEIARVKVPL
jgi:hypothetical protein